MTIVRLCAHPKPQQALNVTRHIKLLLRRQIAKDLQQLLTQCVEECSLELHPAKTQIVYCVASNRKGQYSVGSFDYLDCTFRPRSWQNRHRQLFPIKLWMDIALENNLVLVVPDGSMGPDNTQGWNDCRIDAPTNPSTDDVLFLGNLVELVQRQYGSGYSKIYVAGVSNGAHMAMRLADEKPELLKAFATVVASRPVNSECVESALPLPLLIMNGTSDPIAPYDGGQIKSDRGEVFSTDDTVNYWVNRNQTDLTPVETVIADSDSCDNSSVVRYRYANPSNNAVVVHYEVTNGCHTESCIAERYSNVYRLIVGNQNGDIETAYEIWNFFKSLAIQPGEYTSFSG